MNFKKLKKRKMIGRNISIVYRATKSMFEHTNRSLNFNVSMAELPILSFLIEEEDKAISQESITKALGIDKATTTRGIKKLCNSGYIVREKDKRDKRAYNISITKEGKALKMEIMNMMCKWTDIIYEGLSKEEVDKLKEITDKMTDNIRVYKEKIKYED